MVAVATVVVSALAPAARRGADLEDAGVADVWTCKGGASVGGPA